MDTGSVYRLTCKECGHLTAYVLAGSPYDWEGIYETEEVSESAMDKCDEYGHWAWCSHATPGTIKIKQEQISLFD